MRSAGTSIAPARWQYSVLASSALSFSSESYRFTRPTAGVPRRMNWLKLS